MRLRPRQWLTTILVIGGLITTVGATPALAVTSSFDAPTGTVTVSFGDGDLAEFGPRITSDAHVSVCATCNAALAGVDPEAVRLLIVNAAGSSDMNLTDLQHFRNTWGRIPITVNSPADMFLTISGEHTSQIDERAVGNVLTWTDPNGESTVTMAVHGLSRLVLSGTDGNDVFDFRQMTLPVTAGHAYHSGPPAMSVDLLDGNDVFYGPISTKGSRIALGKGDDSIHLFGGPDYVLAGGGDDSVWTGDGDDIVHGDAGNDVIVTGNGNDSVGDVSGTKSTVNLGSGNDHATTWVPNVTVYGGPGNDVLSAIGRVVKHAWLWGGAGRDELDVPRRIDAHLNCGRGRDTVQHNARHMSSCEHTIRP